MIVSRNWLLRLHNFTRNELVTRRAGDDLQTRCLPKQVRVSAYVRDSLTSRGYIELVAVDHSSTRHRPGDTFRMTVSRAKRYYARELTPSGA